MKKLFVIIMLLFALVAENAISKPSLKRDDNASIKKTKVKNLKKEKCVPCHTGSQIILGKTMESYDVRLLSDFVTEYKDKRRIILKDLDSRPELSIEQKIRIYEEEMKKLKTLFSQNRRAEYESKSIELSREHSCTKGSSGGVKNCGWHCVDAPRAGLYTQAAWVRVEGTNKGLTVSETQACLKMTRAGKGRNAGTVFATFKYKDGYITQTIAQETVELFNLIVV